MVIALSPQQRQFVQQQVEQFYIRLSQWEILPIRRALESFEVPPSIKAVEDAVEQWRQLFTPSADAPEGQPITDSFVPLLKAALLARRRAVAADIDRRREKTQHPEAIDILNAELRPFDEIASQPWFRAATPLALPRVADFLNLEELERILQERVLQQGGAAYREREYDEKFRLLQAPGS